MLLVPLLSDSMRLHIVRFSQRRTASGFQQDKFHVPYSMQTTNTDLAKLNIVAIFFETNLVFKI